MTSNVAHYFHAFTQSIVYTAGLLGSTSESLVTGAISLAIQQGLFSGSGSKLNF